MAVIENISIKHFKSIRELSFDCRRVNVFIGEPNTGKSNILEALGVFSADASTCNKILRYKSPVNLFFDNDVSEDFSITAMPYTLAGNFNGGRVEMKTGIQENKVDNTLKVKNLTSFYLSEKDKGGNSGNPTPFRFYRFSAVDTYFPASVLYLSTPDGDNLFDMLLTNKNLRGKVSAIFRDKGYRLSLRTESREIEILKDVDEVVYSYPLHTVSDTLQRIIFYTAVLETNRDAILLLEEPEAHLFPFFTKQFAERVALDEAGNQFFIATHNPYFLLSLIEKTPASELCVYIVSMKNYETVVTPVSAEGIATMLDDGADTFFNLHHLAGDAL